MNCKPGDLARVISCEKTREVGIVDKIIKITRLTQNYWGVPSWNFEGRLRGSSGAPVTCIPDSMLRPIRDPGDDAQDQTLTWAPRREEVPA
jgi:hypothetical protein